VLKVAFVGALAASFAERVRAHLSLPCEFVLADDITIESEIASIDVLVTLVFTAEMAAEARRLRLVQVPGAGLDRIDRRALPAGAALANVYGHETGIAEFVIGAMLALTRDFGRLDAELRCGRWVSQWAVDRPPPSAWPELAGKRLAILGYGRIGRSVAHRARAFGMRISAVRQNLTASVGDELEVLGGLEILDEVLERSDYLVITLPLSPATHCLVGDREFALMKPSAVLVNVARGEIVDEDALFEALAGRQIAGAAIDVWYRYPSVPGAMSPSRRPFHELPNVLMTPHVSGWTAGMLEARAALIAENIERVARGAPPLNSIPPAA